MDSFEISVKRFDEFASEYAERFMNIDSYCKHFDKFIDLIESSRPKVLELGCDPGNVTRYIKQGLQLSDIIAVDLVKCLVDNRFSIEYNVRQDYY